MRAEKNVHLGIAPTVLAFEQVEIELGGRQIVSPTSIEVRRGEFICIIGPSGCGKTTLLRGAAGFLLPTGGRIVDPQRIECGHQILPGLARGDHAEAGALVAHHHPVDPVRPREGLGGLQLVDVETLLLRQRHGLADAVVGPADVHAPRRQCVVVGLDEVRALGVDGDRGRALDGVVNALHRHPGTRIARHGDAEQAEVQDLAHGRRVQHRHHGIDHGELGLVRRGARLADMVVAEQAEHACDAFRRYGKGRHAAGLNFGDVFAYALASTTGEPLLFKGNDFARTDITSAAWPGPEAG